MYIMLNIIRRINCTDTSGAMRIQANIILVKALKGIYIGN